MRSSENNFIVIFGLLGLACLISWSLYLQDFHQQDTVDIKKFPVTVAGWTSQDMPIPKEDLEILETDNAFVRRYTNPQGRNVYLYLVYSQTNRKVSHPPEICYTGGGISILDKRQEALMSSPNLTVMANRLRLQSKGGENQVAFYWFKAGKNMTASYARQQLLVAMKMLLAQRSGSALIRLSADVTNNNEETPVQDMREFTRLITPLLFEYLP